VPLELCLEFKGRVIKMTKTITEKGITPSINEKASFLGSIRESFSLKKGKELYFLLISFSHLL
jgi:hypothetical protein